MVIKIAHRGNRHGPSPSENSPSHILTALDAGFDVEVDIRISQDAGKDEWYLGHDTAQYRIQSPSAFDTDRIWWHAKTPETALRLHDMGLHVFSHDKDPWTVTSWGFVWHYPNSVIPEQIRGDSVQVLPELGRTGVVSGVYAVCSDFVGEM